MNTINDDKIQELLENGFLDKGTPLSAAEEKDLKMYEQLFVLLKKEPGMKLPSGFSANVITKLQAKQDLKHNAFLYILVVSLIIGCTFFISALIPKENISALADTFYKFRWICIFIFILFLVIHFADRKLFRHTPSIGSSFLN